MRVGGYVAVLLVVLFFTMTLANATTYYVSNTGNDANSGTSTSAPWQSLVKVNSFSPSPGDQILFKRGDSWEGTLTPSRSGVAGNPITYSAYGSGEKPVLFGSTTITGWSLYSGHIYKASSSSTITQLFLNGERMRAARYPNSGYAFADTITSQTQFTDNDLSASNDYAGALAIFRTSRWRYWSQPIASSSGNTLTLAAAVNGDISTTKGFILVNNLAFLDEPGEWYYDNNTKNIYFWTPHGDTPANYNIRGTIYDNAIYLYFKSYLTFDSLELRDAYLGGSYQYYSAHITLTNSSIHNVGQYGIYAIGSSGAIITNNEIYDSSSDGVALTQANATISNNSIHDIGLFDSIGVRCPGTSTALLSTSNNGILTNNRINRVAYNGIMFSGTNTLIKYNFINSTNMFLDDGASIYTYQRYYNTPGSEGTIISNNIVLNVFGNPDGVDASYPIAYGIYLDKNTHKVLVENNTVAHAPSAFTIGETNENNTIQNNLFMDFVLGSWIGSSSNTYPNYLLNNIFYATDRYGSFVWWTNKPQRFIHRSGVIDLRAENNTYIDHYAVDDRFFDWDGDAYFSSLASWQAASGQDQQSTFDSTSLPAGYKEKLFYNDALTTRTINLDSIIYEDLQGNQVTGSLTLEPFTSRLLIDTGQTVDLTAPTVSSFTLPSTASSLTVPIIFVATDDVGVTGYMLSSSATAPSATTTGWSSTAPDSYTFSTAGAKTLYAWAKDAAGHVSLTVSASVTITLPTGVYYVSSSTGNDANTGTSPSVPWKTLDKVNSFIPQPGESVLFKRGDSWEGTLIPPASGTAGNPITYGAYGSGAHPKLYGSTSITGWSLYSGNIYKATVSSYVSQVYVDGVQMQAARTPNNDYAIVSSVTNQTIFSSTNLSSSVDYTGATIIAKTRSWRLYGQTVTSSSGTTLTLAGLFDLGTVEVGEGFILVNKLSLLDQAGEWYYDTATKTLYAWMPDNASPSTHEVRGTVRDDNILVSGKKYLSFDSLGLIHSTDVGFFMTQSSESISVTNSVIAYANRYGLRAGFGFNKYLTFINNTITNSSGIGINAYADNSFIINNTIEHIGLLENIGAETPLQSIGISFNGATGTSTTIEHNIVEHIGGNGMSFIGANLSIRYNFINDTCTVLDDGASLYTWVLESNTSAQQGSIISHNIILNGEGNLDGKTSPVRKNGLGIYLDANSHGLTVEHNTLVDVGQAFQLGPLNNTFRYNTVYGAALGFWFGGATGPVYVYNNTFYQTDRLTSHVWWVNSLGRFGKIDNPDGSAGLFLDYNRYIAHYEDRYMFSSSEIPPVYYFANFSAYQSYFPGEDVHSTVDASSLPVGYTDKILYNAKLTSQTIDLLGRSFTDINGNTVTGSVTLAPFTSIILIGTDFSGIDTINPDTIVSTPVCGDGVVDAGESCDDASYNGLLCSAVCGSSCSYCTSACTIATVSGGDCPADSSVSSTFLFEESSGTSVAGTNSVSGVLDGSFSRVSGVTGNGLSLSGNGYIALGSYFGDISDQLSLVAWLKPAVSGGYMGVVMHGGPSVDSFALYVYPDARRVAFKTSGTSAYWTAVDNVSALWDGGWHQVVATFDGSRKVIFLDNDVLVNVSSTGSIDSGLGYHAFIGAGRDGTPSLFYSGLIDEVRLYNYSLSADEVFTLYDAVVGDTCNDGILNGDEEGIDCGGSCSSACTADASSSSSSSSGSSSSGATYYPSMTPNEPKTSNETDMRNTNTSRISLYWEQQNHTAAMATVDNSLIAVKKLQALTSSPALLEGSVMLLSTTDLPFSLPANYELYQHLAFINISPTPIAAFDVSFTVNRSWLTSLQSTPENVHLLVSTHTSWSEVNVTTLNNTLYTARLTSVPDHLVIVAKYPLTASPSVQTAQPSPIPESPSPIAENIGWLVYVIALFVVIVALTGGIIFFISRHAKAQSALPNQTTSTMVKQDPATIPPTLTSYISRMKEQGFSDQIIRESLSSVGWDKTLLDNAFTTHDNHDIHHQTPGGPA